MIFLLDNFIDLTSSKRMRKASDKMAIPTAGGPKTDDP